PVGSARAWARENLTQETLPSNVSHQQPHERGQRHAAQYPEELRGQRAACLPGLGLEILDALEPRLVFVIEQRGGRWDDGKSIGLEREVGLRLAAAVFSQTGMPGRPTVTPVHDDVEIVLRAKRRLESRDEVPARERMAGDDTQVSRLNGHKPSQRQCMRAPTDPSRL